MSWAYHPLSVRLRDKPCPGCLAIIDGVVDWVDLHPVDWETYQPDKIPAVLSMVCGSCQRWLMDKTYGDHDVDNPGPRLRFPNAEDVILLIDGNSRGIAHWVRKTQHVGPVFRCEGWVGKSQCPNYANTSYKGNRSCKACTKHLERGRAKTFINGPRTKEAKCYMIIAEDAGDLLRQANQLAEEWKKIKEDA